MVSWKVPLVDTMFPPAAAVHVKLAFGTAATEAVIVVEVCKQVKVAGLLSVIVGTASSLSTKTFAEAVQPLS